LPESRGGGYARVRRLPYPAGYGSGMEAWPNTYRQPAGVRT
jgi:hypothetical protein